MLCINLNGFLMRVDVMVLELQKLFICLFVLLTLSYEVGEAYAAASVSRAKGSITVMADPSMTIPITLIARRFSRAYNMPVSVEFASTKEQIDKVEQGAEANVFISAKPLWIKQMQRLGLIDVYSRTNIAKNQLVLMGPLGAKTHTGELTGKTLMKLLPTGREGFQFTLGDPEYLAEGTYTLEALGVLDVEEELEQYYAIVRTVPDIIRMIGTYNGYGVMYRSDALLYDRIAQIGLMPEPSHTPVIYQAVVVAGEYMNEAREFLKYMQLPASQAIFKQAGFLAAPVDEEKVPPVDAL